MFLSGVRTFEARVTADPYTGVMKRGKQMLCKETMSRHTFCQKTCEKRNLSAGKGKRETSQSLSVICAKVKSGSWMAEK